MVFRDEDVAIAFSANVALGWDEKDRHIASIHGDDNLLPKMVHHLAGDRELDVLEVGCATAKFLHRLDREVGHLRLTGIDASADMIRVAQQRQWNRTPTLINTSLADFRTDRKFDLIILKQVLHHISDPVEALKRVGRLLSPTGAVIVMLPNEKHAEAAIPYQSRRDPLGRYTEEQVQAFARDAGLEVVDVQNSLARAKFSSLYSYFAHLDSIGSLHKLFDYTSDAVIARRFTEFFRTMLTQVSGPEVVFAYSYFVMALGAHGDSSHDAALRRSFNDWSSTYEAEVTRKLALRGYSYPELAELIRDEVDTHGDPGVTIEIGTGPGTLGRHFAAVAAGMRRFVGMDVSDGMLRLAERTGVYDSLINGAADKHPIPPDATALISSFAYHSFEHPLRFFANVASARDLRVIVLVDLFPADGVIAARSAEHSSQNEHGAPERYVTVEDFQRTVERTDFTIVTQRQLGISKDYNHWLFTLIRSGNDGPTS